MKIGITGTIGAGKSSVSQYIRDSGYHVYDMDRLTHSFYEPNGILYDYIIALLGSQILETDGTVNRQKMSTILFKNPEMLAELERNVFSEVRVFIEEIIDNEKSIIFFEVPLLFEANMEDLFDSIIMVSADYNTRIQRLLARGMKMEDINLRMNRQYSEIIKEEKSDYILYNNGTLSELNYDTEILIQRIKMEGLKDARSRL
ncbi:dephospho-CoA kinase [Erysipelothrix piscisicarius]|uniref:Dephospho-CoA kinase n=1 Tax=Erysipelothrix piscisicarius TaxID=2485784 RepID=A0A3Q8S7H3_9FIRM|nr:dephospho-CoA kinase [Erysipelothrix piscisicarius]AZK44207.1 dephospho-CoA kinase [Erysipelothrix piscisicarius]